MQKHNIIKKLVTFVITLAITLSLLPTTAYAENDNYDGTGTGQSSATQLKENGASVTRQFIRMYVIETEHGHNYTEAVDVILGTNPSGYYTLQDIRPDLQVARVTPNVTSVTRQSNTLGIPNPILWTGNNFVSNAANFKEWMMSDSGNGSLNIEKVIAKYFGEDVLDLFKDTTTEKALVIENGWYHGVYDGMSYQGWKFYGTAKDWVQMQKDQGLANGGFTKSLDNNTGQTALMLAYPILGLDTDFSIYSNITHDAFSTHGYGLHVYYNDLSGQTTCDEPQMPTPHASAKESDGKCKIVKTYRVKDSNNNYQDKGTYIREEVDGNIQIENEQGFNVVAWASSKTFNSNPGYSPWSPPQELGTGKVAKNVKVPTGGTLYVLLEKTEESPVVLDDYEYKISQSRITKRISMSNPDNPNGILEKIVNTQFTWTIDGHHECEGHSCHGCSCPGHSHWDPDASTGNYGKDGNEILGAEVEDPCPENGKCICPGGHKVCVFESPASWKGDRQLSLSLNNTLQEDYQTVLVPQASEEWNVETRTPKGTEKSFYNNEPSFDREDPATSAQEYGPETNWDYTCVIMRGKDKLTLSKWINNGEGNQQATDALTDLVDVSDAGFISGDTPQGTRKINDYNDAFRVFLDIDDNYDIHTTWKAIKQNPIPECKCGGSPNHGSLCGSTLYAEVNNWMSGHIRVRVECYSGQPDGGTNDTSYNPAEIITPATRLSGYNTTSGRMVQGKTITFYPYIEMQYDKVPVIKLPAFVMGQYSRQITVNDFAEINWNKQSTENLTIFSNQWSTHAQAKHDYGAENVIPGGAQMQAKIKDPDRQIVNVVSYQVALDGTGLTQVEKTGSYDPSQTIPNAQGEHASYVSSVVQGLEATSIIQYASDDKDHAGNVWEFGDKVYPGSSLSCIGSSLTASVEDKYYFRDEGALGDSQQGDFDVENLGTEMHTYTFYTTTSGGINCSKDNTSPKNGENNASAFERQLINERTGVEDKLAAGLEHGTGNDPEAHTGTTWYNEAFDGVTIVVQSTNLRVGYKYPTERLNVIDPKLCPPSIGQSDMLTNYNVSQYRTKSYSAAYGEDYLMGVFKLNNVKMIDLDNFFWSRKFWIANITTQDLH